MKFLSRLSFFAAVLAFSSILSTGYALSAGKDNGERALSLDEVQSLISELGTGGDATAGTVPVDVDSASYDIYARQIAYRENVKAFRQSLDERRENYQSSYIDQKTAYQSLMEKVYKAEIAAYQKSLGKEKPSKKKSIGQVVAEVSDAPDMSDAGADDADAVAENDEGLKEADIPPQEGEEGKVKKKVVTSDDAPDFDPADVEGGADEEPSDAEVDLDILDESEEEADELGNPFE